VIPVTDFYKDFGNELVDKFSDMSGVKQIARTTAKQTASDLGFLAAEKIFESGKIKREDIRHTMLLEMNESTLIKTHKLCFLYIRTKNYKPLRKINDKLN
jgi:hypothetical protein